MAALVRAHAVDNTVVVTFGNERQKHFTLNWVHHLQQIGVGGLLVGMMNSKPAAPKYVQIARSLRAHGVGVYTVNSAEVKRQPQGGRWFHVLPLLRTGARVLLSDSDAVWLRDPRPYFRALEAAHPRLDFAVSTDAQFGTDGRRLGADGGGGKRRRHGARAGASGAATTPSDDLDVEDFGHCWQSMNIGVMFFPPGPSAGVGRAGAMRAMEEATAHLSMEGNLGRVDQGPINYRWKHGAGGGAAAWRWKRQLHRVKDGSGKRLCGLCNGTVVAGVLPAAQFTNTLTHSVLKLWEVARVTPFVVHATWMRRQEEPWKRMRLRQARAAQARPPRGTAPPPTAPPPPTARRASARARRPRASSRTTRASPRRCSRCPRSSSVRCPPTTSS